MCYGILLFVFSAWIMEHFKTIYQRTFLGTSVKGLMVIFKMDHMRPIIFFTTLVGARDDAI